LQGEEKQGGRGKKSPPNKNIKQEAGSSSEELKGETINRRQRASAIKGAFGGGKEPKVKNQEGPIRKKKKKKKRSPVVSKTEMAREKKKSKSKKRAPKETPKGSQGQNRC